MFLSGYNCFLSCVLSKEPEEEENAGLRMYIHFSSNRLGPPSVSTEDSSSVQFQNVWFLEEKLYCLTFYWLLCVKTITLEEL